VKQKHLDEARKTIERLKTEYPEQNDALAKAQSLLPDSDAKPAPKSEKHVATAAEIAQAAELVKQGWQKYREGNFKLADELFKKSLNLDSNSVDAWTGLGWSMMNTNLLTGQNQFAKALQLDPNNAMALNGMGWAMSHIGDAEEQRRNTDYWRRAVEADPTATSPMRGLAQNAYSNADFDEAIKWYEKWVALDPKNADAIAGLEQAKQGQTAVEGATAVATDFFKKLDGQLFAETGTLTGPYLVATFNSGEVSGGIRPNRGKSDEQEKHEWVEFLRKYREPLGKTIERKLEAVKYTRERKSVGTAGAHFSGRIDGIIVASRIFQSEFSILLQFNTKYENKRNVVELLSLGLGQTFDGEWKINGYGIEETPAPRDPLKD
jgi:tetratricopeptide (TPR) repeat protein